MGGMVELCKVLHRSACALNVSLVFLVYINYLTGIGR